MNTNHPSDTIYILGAGSIGFPLAANLSAEGKNVIAVRTSNNHFAKSTIPIMVSNGTKHHTSNVKMISLSRLSSVNGIIVITAKSFANKAIAQALKKKSASGPIIIMQNGIGVEKPFMDAGFSQIYRCVLYITSQLTSQNEYATRPVTASPIGIIKGNKSDLTAYVDALNTVHFPLRTEKNIQKEIWKKAIINVVFNSICPLLEVDNGIFVRNKKIEAIGRKLIKECLVLTEKLSIDLQENEIMDQVLKISKSSDGKLISTLQDIKNGRQTEMEYLNLEMVRMAASFHPSLNLPSIEMLGKLIEVKASKQVQNKPV